MTTEAKKPRQRARKKPPHKAAATAGTYAAADRAKKAPKGQRDQMAKLDADARRAAREETRQARAQELALVQEKAAKKLEPIGREIKTRLEKAEKYAGQANDMRLAASLRLAEAQAICKESKLPFKKWVEDNVGTSYTEAHRLAIAGAADDPAKALALLRAKSAERMRGTRARRKQAREEAAAQRGATEPTPAETAPEPAREPVRRYRKLAEEPETYSETVARVDRIREDFNELSANDKLEFLKWATDVIGAQLVLDSDGDGGAVKSMPGYRDKYRKTRTPRA